MLQPMPTLDTPLLLAPDFKEKIWGRENLEPLYPSEELAEDATPEGFPGKSASADTVPRIGEAWLTGEKATFLSGPVAGLTLGELFRRSPRELCGSGWKGDQFPLLAKFLFTSDWLSMQVHPDDEYAAKHEKSRGKTEAWYMIECDPEAEIALGVPPGTTREALEAACREARSLEVASRFRPAPGGTVFVPSGTLHALGPGLVLFEVSETSDVTYRLDDYARLDDLGRPRPLHLERGLETTRLEAPVLRDLTKIEFPEPFGSRRWAVACRYFAVEELAVRTAAAFPAANDRVECLTVIRGSGRVEIPAGWLAYRPGQTWLIPAGCGPFRLMPESSSRLIRFYVPNLDRDFRQPLTIRGASQEQIRSVVFDD
jgi:mannose-6-phosphate isomerase